MSADAVSPAVEYFWRQAACEEPFPRFLESAALWALPVAVVRLPRLWVADVEVQMLRYGFPWRGPAPTICLRGFMLATRGKGFLFIDGGDAVSEQRYSLAHEIAHFLLDYHLPRLDAIQKLGPGIVEVLDCVRAPTLRERVHAALAVAQIGTYQHITQRGLAPPEREDRADAVAVELLAPASEVWRRCRDRLSRASRDACCQLVQETLETEFGLPTFAAAGTAALLARRWWPQPTFQQWMGIKR